MANSFDQIWKSITGIPTADLTDKRYRFGAFGTDGSLKVASATDYPIGVIYEPNKAEQPTQVVASGFAFVVLGATLTAGVPVASDTNGKAIAFVDGTTGPIVGILAVGGDADELGTILLK